MSKIFILAGHTFKELIRKKDFYVLLFLFFGLILFFYNETFLGVADVSRYLKDVGFSFIILFSMIIAVSFSAKQIPSEIESKTVYPILAKPVSRTQFILGKFAGSILISTITFTVFYMVFLSFIFAKGEAASLCLVAQSYLFSILLLSLISSISVLFSLFLTVAANITITLLLYFFIYWYNGMLKGLISQASGKMSIVYNALYYILPHFEFYDTKIRLVHLWDPLPGWVVISVLIYTFLYISLIIWLAGAIFKRKGL